MHHIQNYVKFNALEPMCRKTKFVSTRNFDSTTTSELVNPVIWLVNRCHVAKKLLPLLNTSSRYVNYFQFYWHRDVIVTRVPSTNSLAKQLHNIMCRALQSVQKYIDSKKLDERFHLDENGRRKYSESKNQKESLRYADDIVVYNHRHNQNPPVPNCQSCHFSV